MDVVFYPCGLLSSGGLSDNLFYGLNVLSFELLKNNSGLRLFGHYDDLKTLGNVVHEVNEKSRILTDKEGIFLALAYDARKAYERQRTILSDPQDENGGDLYGVEILWPILLVQARMLRASLSYFDSTKLQQMVAYSLEDIIEGAIEITFGADASDIKHYWYRINPEHRWVEEKLLSRTNVFCRWTPRQRKTNLVGLLQSLDPMYPVFYPMMTNAGTKGILSPQEYDAMDDAEWLDPSA